MWLTPTRGFPIAAARDFEAFMPTLKHPGIPFEIGGIESRKRKTIEDLTTWTPAKCNSVYIFGNIHASLIKCLTNCKRLKSFKD